MDCQNQYLTLEVQNLQLYISQLLEEKAKDKLAFQGKVQGLTKAHVATILDEKKSASENKNLKMELADRAPGHVEGPHGQTRHHRDPAGRRAAAERRRDPADDEDPRRRDHPAPRSHGRARRQELGAEVDCGGHARDDQQKRLKAGRGRKGTHGGKGHLCPAAGDNEL